MFGEGDQALMRVFNCGLVDKMCPALVLFIQYRKCLICAQVEYSKNNGLMTRI